MISNHVPRCRPVLALLLPLTAVLVTGCVVDQVPIGGDEAAQAGAPSGGSGGLGAGGVSTGGAESGGATSGGASGSGGAPPRCVNEREEIVAFLASHDSCTTDSDCGSFEVGCGVTEFGCTGAVYVSQSADIGEGQALAETYRSCMGEDPSCARCLLIRPSAACQNGLCRPDQQFCSGDASAMRDFIDANKACSVDSDCQAYPVGCGITEDDCTGMVYVNQSTDPDAFASVRSSYTTCMGAETSCALCERMYREPVCLEGNCMPDGACGTEGTALREFIAGSKSCQTTDDCTTTYVGCGITEDECTGAVYLSAEYDRTQFEQLQGAFEACMPGDCIVCDRASPGPECVNNACQRGGF